MASSPSPRARKPRASSAPDATYGEAVAAFVEPRRSAGLSADAVIEHCRAQLAGYKKPRHVFFVDALPRNSIGKVLKAELRKRLQ